MRNHRERERQKQRGEERWTEVRIETSFHLATLMAAMMVSTTKDIASDGGGGGVTSIQKHSAVQVSCSAERRNKTRLSAGSPGRRVHKQNHSMKFERTDHIDHLHSTRV